MPIQVHGWVEVSNWDAQWRVHAHAWQELLSLSAFQLGACSTAELLFGFSAACILGQQTEIKSVAMGRGLPPNPSIAVSSAAEKIRQHDLAHGTGDFVGFTFADMEELRAAAPDLFNAGLESRCNWRLVFRLVESLRREAEFAESAFRIVCWLDW